MRSFLSNFSYYEFLEIIDLIEDFRGNLCLFEFGSNQKGFYISVHNGYKTTLLNLKLIRGVSDYRVYDNEGFFLFEFRNFEELGTYFKHISKGYYLE